MPDSTLESVGYINEKSLELALSEPDWGSSSDVVEMGSSGGGPSESSTVRSLQEAGGAVAVGQGPEGWGTEAPGAQESMDSGRALRGEIVGVVSRRAVAAYSRYS